ncbi:MAG: TetR/AcrR family transcriptional regulator [Myxococcota bacterium]
MKKTGYHHGDLRSALLNAARTLVAEHGPDGFTMARAARQAGVSSGAPYKHFADRAALMNALAEQGRAALMERVNAASAHVTDPLEAFRQVGIAYAQFAVDEPGWFRVMGMPEYLGTIDDDPDIVGFWKPLAEMVNSVPADAKLPADHPLIASFAARVLVHGLASMLVAGTLDPLGIQRDRAAQLADAITSAIDLPGFKRP